MTTEPTEPTDPIERETNEVYELAVLSNLDQAFEGNKPTIVSLDDATHYMMALGQVAGGLHFTNEALGLSEELTNFSSLTDRLAGAREGGPDSDAYRKLVDDIADVAYVYGKALARALYARGFTEKHEHLVFFPCHQQLAMLRFDGLDYPTVLAL